MDPPICRWVNAEQMKCAYAALRGEVFCERHRCHELDCFNGCSGAVDFCPSHQLVGCCYVGNQGACAQTILNPGPSVPKRSVYCPRHQCGTFGCTTSKSSAALYCVHHAPNTAADQTTPTSPHSFEFQHFVDPLQNPNPNHAIPPTPQYPPQFAPSSPPPLAQPHIGKKKKKKNRPMGMQIPAEGMTLLNEKISSLRGQSMVAMTMSRFGFIKGKLFDAFQKDNETDDDESSSDPEAKFRTLFDHVEDITAHGEEARSVELVRHKTTGVKMICKKIHSGKYDDDIVTIQNEIQILHRIISANVVNFYCSYTTDREVRIVMEYMDAHCLDTMLLRVGRIDEKELGYMMAETVNGLLDLEEEKILHRDIKPSNILVNSNGEIKICDFGTSKRMQDIELSEMKCQTWVGTKVYMSPERLKGNAYALSSDIWSLGLSVYELAMGFHPLDSHEGKGSLAPVTKKNPRDPNFQLLPRKRGNAAVFELLAKLPTDTELEIELVTDTTQEVSFSYDINDFVQRCVNINPGSRMNLDECKNHQWIADCRERITQEHMKTYIIASMLKDPEIFPILDSVAPDNEEIIETGLGDRCAEQVRVK